MTSISFDFSLIVCFTLLFLQPQKTIPYFFCMYINIQFLLVVEIVLKSRQYKTVYFLVATYRLLSLSLNVCSIWWSLISDFTSVFCMSNGRSQISRLAQTKIVQTKYIIYPRHMMNWFASNFQEKLKTKKIQSKKHYLLAIQPYDPIILWYGFEALEKLLSGKFPGRAQRVWISRYGPNKFSENLSWNQRSFFFSFDFSFGFSSNFQEKLGL